MRETKVYCDHCGKVLDGMVDYNDTEIDVKSWFKCDLCAKCIEELDEIVLRFCKKGGAE
jgi:hypothetical protein